ncbi:hypothetical protein BC937DRAFT_95440, partial [Endogone sp. FLAS-F59071]
NKFLDDNTFTNKTWSEVTGMKVHDLDIMELEFLDVLEFRLFVKDNEYARWCQALEKYRNQMAAAGATEAHNQQQRHMFAEALRSMGILQHQEHQAWAAAAAQQQQQQEVARRQVQVQAQYQMFLLQKAQQPQIQMQPITRPLVRVPLMSRLPVQPVYILPPAPHGAAVVQQPSPAQQAMMNSYYSSNAVAAAAAAATHQQASVAAAQQQAQDPQNPASGPASVYQQKSRNPSPTQDQHANVQQTAYRPPHPPMRQNTSSVVYGGAYTAPNPPPTGSQVPPSSQSGHDGALYASQPYPSYGQVASPNNAPPPASYHPQQPYPQQQPYSGQQPYPGHHAYPAQQAVAPQGQPQAPQSGSNMSYFSQSQQQDPRPPTTHTLQRSSSLPAGASNIASLAAVAQAQAQAYAQQQASQSLYYYSTPNGANGKPADGGYMGPQTPGAPIPPPRSGYYDQHVVSGSGSLDPQSAQRMMHSRSGSSVSLNLDDGYDEGITDSSAYFLHHPAPSSYYAARDPTINTGVYPQQGGYQQQQGAYTQAPRAGIPHRSSMTPLNGPVPEDPRTAAIAYRSSGTSGPVPEDPRTAALSYRTGGQQAPTGPVPEDPRTAAESYRTKR